MINNIENSTAVMQMVSVKALTYNWDSLSDIIEVFKVLLGKDEGLAYQVTKEDSQDLEESIKEFGSTLNYISGFNITLPVGVMSSILLAITMALASDKCLKDPLAIEVYKERIKSIGYLSGLVYTVIYKLFESGSSPLEDKTILKTVVETLNCGVFIADKMDKDSFDAWSNKYSKLRETK